jgi:hypothetical protein
MVSIVKGKVKGTIKKRNGLNGRVVILEKAQAVTSRKVDIVRGIVSGRRKRNQNGENPIPKMV